MIDTTGWTFQQKKEYLENCPQPEWDAICKRCGICCLVKLSMGGGIVYTTLACNHLDLQTKQCTVFKDRLKNQNNCSKLDVEGVIQGELVPASCGYSEFLFGPAKCPADVNFQDVKHEGNAKEIEKIIRRIEISWHWNKR